MVVCGLGSFSRRRLVSRHGHDSARLRRTLKNGRLRGPLTWRPWRASKRPTGSGQPIWGVGGLNDARPRCCEPARRSLTTDSTSSATSSTAPEASTTAHDAGRAEAIDRYPSRTLVVKSAPADSNRSPVASRRRRASVGEMSNKMLRCGSQSLTANRIKVSRVLMGMPRP